MLTIQHKVRQTSKFIAAARNPEIFALLVPVGFTREELGEGVRLILRTAQVRRLGAPRGLLDQALIERTEAYQSYWFALVRAVLTRGYPEFVGPFFDKLTQLRGKEAALSLARFLDKLRRLDASEAPFEEKGAEARALLALRTLTAQVEAEGNALLTEWSSLATAQPDSGEFREAMDEAWRWYCEWRDLARLAIKSRRALRALGVGRHATASDEELVLENDSDEPKLPAVPASAVQPADMKNDAAQ